MKQIIIFANGDLDWGEAVEQTLARPSWVIGADGGAELARQLGQPLGLLIGDFDSVSAETLAFYADQGCETLRFPPEKNQTDLELAFGEAVKRGAESITVIGALGKRLDHTLANIYLLNLPQLAGVEVSLVAGRQTLRVLRAGSHQLMGAIGDTLSLIPLGGDVEGISTENLQYPLSHETLAFGPARGVSNVITGLPPNVRFERGQLLMVHTLA